MKKYLFCVWDSAAGAYLDPFVAPSVEYAIREFRSVCNREGHQFNKFPADFTLFLIGSFDPITGRLEDPGKITSLGVALTFISSQLEADNA